MCVKAEMRRRRVRRRTAATPGDEPRLHQLTRANRRMKVIGMRAELAVCVGALGTRLSSLGYSKVCARWFHGSSRTSKKTTGWLTVRSYICICICICQTAVDGTAPLRLKVQDADISRQRDEQSSWMESASSSWISWNQRRLSTLPVTLKR